MSSSLSLSSKIAFLDDSDEEQEDNEDNEDMLLAFVLVGEYLSVKEERPTFYVRNRMEWERHIAEIPEEGRDESRIWKSRQPRIWK